MELSGCSSAESQLLRLRRCWISDMCNIYTRTAAKSSTSTRRLAHAYIEKALQRRRRRNGCRAPTQSSPLTAELSPLATDTVVSLGTADPDRFFGGIFHIGEASARMSARTR